MKKIFYFFALNILSVISFCSCSKHPAPPVYVGTVIGFDQCNGRPDDSAAKGYVIKIQSVTGRDTTVVDTSLTYNLPNAFVFHPYLFTEYKFTYLFPPKYQNNYRFWFSYIKTPKKDMVYSLCTSDIFVASLIDIIHKQIIITNFYGTIP